MATKFGFRIELGLGCNYLETERLQSGTSYAEKCSYSLLTTSNGTRIHKKKLRAVQESVLCFNISSSGSLRLNNYSRSYFGQQRSKFSVLCSGEDAAGSQVGTIQEATGTLSSASSTQATDNVVPHRSLTDFSNISRTTTSALCITIVGVTGELARSKVLPALFALYVAGRLPERFAIFGYARTPLTDEDMRRMVEDQLPCRVDREYNCSVMVEPFLEHCFYESGSYDSCDGMHRLNQRMLEFEGDIPSNRIFYLSVPTAAVVEVATCLSNNASSTTGWTRVIVEKPFGKDGASSAAMSKRLLACLKEEQIYRIDHYLGKELVENLTVLRFSNLIFEPLWSRDYIRNIQVIFAEDWGAGSHGRYFDEYGVIRDIVQSHLLQMIALLAMEQPISLDGEDMRNEKVKVLRCMRRLSLADVCLGQYKESTSKDGLSRIPGYTDETDVAKDSITPTFVAAALYIDNARWDGVPFLIKAGMGLIQHRVEIRIQFRHVPGNLYRERFGLNLDMATNELVIRVQPDEAIFLKVNNKVPGLGLQLDSSLLNLKYSESYDTSERVDSYERLLLDVMMGDSHLFIRSDELKATWDVVDPLLQEIAENSVQPELYPFGGRGPVGSFYLGAKHRVRWADMD